MSDQEILEEYNALLSRVSEARAYEQRFGEGSLLNLDHPFGEAAHPIWSGQRRIVDGGHKRLQSSLASFIGSLTRAMDGEQGDTSVEIARGFTEALKKQIGRTYGKPIDIEVHSVEEEGNYATVETHEQGETTVEAVVYLLKHYPEFGESRTCSRTSTKAKDPSPAFVPRGYSTC